jgi:hypothetical protein
MAPKTDREKLIAFAHKVRKLHELVLRGGTDHERETARRKLEDALAERRMSLADVAELLALAVDNPQQGLQADDEGDDDGSPPPSGRSAGADERQPDVFQLVDWVSRRFLCLADHQHAALVLWILHTHVFQEFEHSPRLVLSSPVRGCGKSVALDVLERLCRLPEKMGSTTTATLPRLIHERQGTVLLDEADNLDFVNEPTLRAVLNDGFKRGAKRMRVIKGEVERSNLYAPVALAGIGRLPKPLMSRSVTINMVRAPREAKIERLDLLNCDIIAELDVVYRHICFWAQSARGKLSTDPEMPNRFHGRAADRWRALLAIADALGHGDEARKAAEAFAAEHQDEDVKVLLLGDIRVAFGADAQLSGPELLARLLAMESDAGWQEFRGEHGEQAPKPLTQPALTKMIAAFGIRKRTVWPKPRTKSCRGYYRYQFEEAWASYCDISDTAPQASKVRHLASA